MIVITSGKKYLDIDSYASMVAYRELLRMLGYKALAVSSAKPNYSVTKSLLDLPYKLDEYQVKDTDEFILVDLSNQDFFEEFVRIDNIRELIDHHPGYQDYWQSKLGNKAIIEIIGSVATIIVEKYIDMNKIKEMDKSIAKLLMAAILDNTLNFTANITTSRDKIAYQVLEDIVGNYNYQEEYFLECEEFIVDNLDASIENDLKVEDVNDYLPKYLGQLTIWSIKSVIIKRDEIESVLNNYGSEWLINIISLSDNKSYIICSNANILDKLTNLFRGDSSRNTLILSPAKLRKEIIEFALNK